MASPANSEPFTTSAYSPFSGGGSSSADHPSTQNWLVAIGTLCLTLSFVFIIARTFVKTYILKKTQVEDYALILAGLGFAAFVGVAIASGNAAKGQHVSVAQEMRSAILGNVVEILYGPTMFLAKLCVLMQMLRVFRGAKKDSVYWLILFLIWFNLAFYVATTFGLVFACGSRSYLSNPMTLGPCMAKTDPYILATSAINIASDFLILLLPVFAVWKLKMALRRKIIISAIFGSGFLACISSIARLVYSTRLKKAHNKTWVVNPVLMWAFAEFTTVILAGALPTIPRLIQWLRGQDDLPRYVQPHQRPLKPSHLMAASGLADVEAAHLGGRMSILSARGKSYIPLEEDGGYVGQGRGAAIRQDHSGTGSSTPSIEGAGEEAL